MKILLINPSWFEGAVLDRLTPMTHPLGLAYIAAILKRNGYNDVQILDARPLGLRLERIVSIIKKLQPQIIGITASTSQITLADKILYWVKKIKPTILCVIGGPHVSALPERTLKETNADVCVVGEGEYTFLDLVKTFEKRADFKEVRGIYYRAENGKIFFTGDRAFICNLDGLPFPTWHLLPPLSSYSPSPPNLKSERKLCASVITTRGCPFKCKFCDKSVFGNTYRKRSAESIIDEIEELIKKYGVREIRFWDDLFTLDKDRVEKICFELMRRELKVSWSCDSRVDTITDKLLELMKKAGCWQISYGIESGSQKILDLLGKGIKLSEVRDTIEISKKVGLSTKGYFMLGLPGDTRETMKKTIEFSESLNLDYAIFSFYSPYPGTEMYASFMKYGTLLASKWDDYIMFGKPTFLPRDVDKNELELFYKKAYFEFYCRPNNVFRMMKNIKDVRTLKSYTKAFAWTASSLFKRIK